MLEKLRRVNGIPGEDDLKELMELIFHYCQAKKSRMESHIFSFYINSRFKSEYPDQFPKSGETFEGMLDNCLKYDLEERIKILAPVCTL